MLSRFSLRTVRTVDVLLILWLLLCVFLGFAVGRRINRLGALGDGLVNAGNGVNHAADAVDRLNALPIVGGAVGAIAEQIRGIGHETSNSGREGKTAVFRIALAVGLLMALVPTIPFIAVWIPLRLRWERERRAVKRALAAGEPGVMEYLAHRTVATRPYSELRGLSEDPWAELRAGRYDRLASPELERLGLTGAPAGALPPPS